MRGSLCPGSSRQDQEQRGATGPQEDLSGTEAEGPRRDRAGLGAGMEPKEHSGLTPEAKTGLLQTGHLGSRSVEQQLQGRCAASGRLAEQVGRAPGRPVPWAGDSRRLLCSIRRWQYSKATSRSRSRGGSGRPAEEEVAEITDSVEPSCSDLSSAGGGSAQQADVWLPGWDMPAALLGRAGEEHRPQPLPGDVRRHCLGTSTHPAASPSWLPFRVAEASSPASPQSSWEELSWVTPATFREPALNGGSDFCTSREGHEASRGSPVLTLDPNDAGRGVFSV